MLLVIPVSEADAQMIEPVSKLIDAFGPYQSHDLLVVGSTPNAERVNALRAAIGPLFRSASTHVFECPARGWPLGPNFYFRSTILHLFGGGLLTQPWYWFELDNTPLQSGWLDALQTEYNLSHAVFMGPKQATYYQDETGALVIQGHHMCGTAIYPANFTEYSSLWKFEEGVAFDVWIQWEVLPHLTDTRLIQHNWKTINYRRRNGQIICDNFDMPHPDLHTNAPLSADAVVCHGCKDGSLARLLIEDLGGRSADLSSEPDPLDSPEAAKPRFDTEQLVFPKTRKRRKAMKEAA